MKVYITSYISNHNIKHFLYFSFRSWILKFNTVVDIFHIIRIFSEDFVVLKMFYINLLPLVDQKLMLGLVLILGILMNFINILLVVYLFFLIKSCPLLLFVWVASANCFLAYFPLQLHQSYSLCLVLFFSVSSVMFCILFHGLYHMDMNYSIRRNHFLIIICNKGNLVFIFHGYMMQLFSGLFLSSQIYLIILLILFAAIEFDFSVDNTFFFVLFASLLTHTSSVS